MASLADGEIIGTYEVLEVMGTGGMATVYRVRHQVLGSEHALKVLDPVLARDPEIRQRFVDEGRIQATLNHPNIVAVTDIVVEPGVAGLVGELVKGLDLDDWIEQEGAKSDAATIKGLFLPILDALAHAHDQGIIHRDIKPSNIIVALNRDGTLRPRLLDFGIAKVLDGGPTARKRATKTGARLGTIQYMSPEQIRGDADLDARTDIFALAVTLYEVLTGEVPFEGGTDYDTMKQIVEGHPVPLKERIPDVGTILSECIDRGLASDRADRFASCQEFAEVLERLGKAPTPVGSPRGRRTSAAPHNRERPSQTSAVAAPQNSVRAQPKAPGRRSPAGASNGGKEISTPLIIGGIAGACLLLCLCGGGLPAFLWYGNLNATDDSYSYDVGSVAVATPAVPVAAATPAARAAAGDIKGTWRISMSAEEQAQLDAARAALAANPEDQMSKAMVEMMTAMLESMSLTITGKKMTMAMGENAEDVRYTLTGDQLTSTDAEGRTETLTVSWDGDTMVWSKEGEDKDMRWNRK